MKGPLSIDEQRLKAATKALFTAVGGQLAAEAITGKSDTHLSRCHLPHHGDFLTLADVLALESVCHGTPGHPPVTRLLCSLLGGAFVALPSAVAGEAELAARFLEMAVQFGDVARTTQAAIADGTCEVDEALDVRRELDELLACGAAFGRQLDAIIHRDGAKASVSRLRGSG